MTSQSGIASMIRPAATWITRVVIAENGTLISTILTRTSAGSLAAGPGPDSVLIGIRSPARFSVAS